jgi:hypothetical protein
MGKSSGKTTDETKQFTAKLAAFIRSLKREARFQKKSVYFK